MVGDWEGLKLGSIPNFFLCFGMHPKIIDVHPKLIPRGVVVQFCPILIRIKKVGSTWVEEAELGRQRKARQTVGPGLQAQVCEQRS